MSVEVTQAETKLEVSVATSVSELTVLSLETSVQTGVQTLTVEKKDIVVEIAAVGLQGPPGPMGPEYEAPDMQLLVDRAGTYTYFGWSAPGTMQNDPTWRIKRLRNKTVVEYADGNEQFDNAWAVRTTLTYL